MVKLKKQTGADRWAHVHAFKTANAFRGIVRHQRSRSLCVAHAERSQPERDVFTRIFDSVFGQDNPEPMVRFIALSWPGMKGMKRVTDEKAVEWYTATTDTWADPLDADDQEMALLRPMLAQTFLEAVPLQCVYDADKHGWSADAFHKQVNTYGGAIVVAQTAGGAVIGGYNPNGWIGLGEDRDSNAAFLFSWPNGDTRQRPIKLPKVGGAAQAILDKAGSGPQFGPDGLRIPLARSDPKRAFCKLGSYYAKTPQGGKMLFAAGEEEARGRGTTLEWLRVYVAAGGPEEWQLDGIMWKTSRPDA